MWLHYSRNEFALSDLKHKEQESEHSEYSKPRGFWITDDSENNWKAWCEAEDFGKDRLKVCYEVTLDESNILFLRTVEDIDAFTLRYKNAPDILSTLSNKWLNRTVINWNEVTKEHSGLVITPYQWERRMERHTIWYYGWDCASGCIWDINVIQNIRLLEKAMA